jgi:hypothetical protein
VPSNPTSACSNRSREPTAGPQVDRAFVRLQLAGDQAEERGLASAVRSDQTDTVARVDRERNRPKNELTAE